MTARPSRLLHKSLIGALCAAAFAVACAQVPVIDVSHRHGNLLAAQTSIRDAYNRLSEAQDANDSHLGGHASRAKELLREAATEVGLAGEELDRR